MTPIETGQSDAAAFEVSPDDRAVLVRDGVKAAAAEYGDQVIDGTLIDPREALSCIIADRDAALAILKRAQAILAEGLATSQSTTARGGPLALGQAAKLALDEINASGVLP